MACSIWSVGSPRRKRSALAWSVSVRKPFLRMEATKWSTSATKNLRCPKQTTTQTMMWPFASQLQECQRLKKWRNLWMMKQRLAWEPQTSKSERRDRHKWTQFRRELPNLRGTFWEHPFARHSELPARANNSNPWRSHTDLMKSIGFCVRHRAKCRLSCRWILRIRWIRVWPALFYSNSKTRWGASKIQSSWAFRTKNRQRNSKSPSQMPTKQNTPTVSSSWVSLSYSFLFLSQTSILVTSFF